MAPAHEMEGKDRKLQFAISSQQAPTGTPTTAGAFCTEGSGKIERRRWARALVVLLSLALTLLAGVFARADESSSQASREELNQIRNQTERILARPEFRRVREQRARPATPDEKPKDKPKRQEPEKEEPRDRPAPSQPMDPSLGSGAAVIASGLSHALLILAYVALGAVAVAIVWFLIQRFEWPWSRETVEKTQEKFEEGDAGTAPGEVAADEYLRRAAELARQGNYRDAIAHLVLGAKSHTERQGLIRFRRGLTHRDYLRALRPQPQKQSAFRALVGVYEPICFGRRPADAEHYQASVSGYEGGFGHA